jgi:hypothetical protein
MILSHLALFCCLSLALPSAAAPRASAPLQTQAANVPKEAALLVPDGTVLVARCESIDRLLELVNIFASLGEAKAGTPLDAAAVLEGMELPGDAAQIDNTRPLLVALSLASGSGEPVTFIVPVKDAPAFQASLGADELWQSAVSGSYVGLSKIPGYAVRTEASGLVSALRPGLVSLHVDLATVIQTFRPLIEMGLDQVEMMMDQASMSEGSVDMSAILELYMDAIWAFVDSANGLDVAFTFDGRLIEAQSTLTTLEGSPLAKFGGDAKHDLRPAARYLDPNAGAIMVMACDWARLVEQFGPTMDALFDAYPADLGAQFKRYMASYEGVLPLMGPLAAASGDLGPGGMRLAYTLTSPKPAELVAGSQQALLSLSGPGNPGDMIKLSAPEPVTIGDVKAIRAHADFNFAALATAADVAGELDDQGLEQMQSVFEAIYGPAGIDITMAPLADRMVMVLGGDAAFATRALALSNTKFEQLPLDLQHALNAATGGSTAFVYRFDYGMIMSQMVPMFATIGMVGMEAFSGLKGSLPVTYWMAIHGTTWSSGVGLDVQRTVEFVREIQKAEAAGRPGDGLPDDEKR